MKVGKGAWGAVEREPIRYAALRIGDAGQKHVRHISFSFQGGLRGAAGRVWRADEPLGDERTNG